MQQIVLYYGMPTTLCTGHIVYVFYVWHAYFILT